MLADTAGGTFGRGTESVGDLVNLERALFMWG